MLTTIQRAMLKADIQSRPNLWNSGHALLGDGYIADFYNSPADPPIFIYRPVVTVRELHTAIKWPELLRPRQEFQLASKLLVWQAMIAGGFIDMTAPFVRQGVAIVFGPQSASDVAINSEGVGTQMATYFEALFASASHVSSVFGIVLQAQDVTDAISG